MTEPQRPDLPPPTRQRWLPLRLGLVELFHYDSEEFWFRDGHLLLRGNNGTGKSKVLSLTLPFLLDANLSSSRVEPDGDRSKRMDWNLLLGGVHERRIGYAWIEFGRLGDDGVAQFRTFGCGLRAVAGRSQVDAWYFMTRQRVGETLWLTTDARTVIAKDRLGEAIAGHGQVFDTAQAYRRAVDEALFGLGETRYAALIDTLIQLRQPQLSKQPDERRLSDALTEALPPLDRVALEDVAEAMNQLDDDRRELDELDAMRRAVQQFDTRYQRYAQIAARRRAADLRSAQTRHDGASRELNQHAVAALTAEAERRAAELASDAEQTRLRELRAQLTVLRADPVMRDAHRLVQADADAQEQARLAAQAQQRRAAAEQRHAAEGSASARRRADAAHAAARLQERLAAAHEPALMTGLAADHQRLIGDPARFDHPDAALGASLRQAADAAVKRRREQVAVLRRRLRELRDAQVQRDQARTQRGAMAESHAAAEQAVEEAMGERVAQGESLLTAARRWLSALQVLAPIAGDEVIAALEAWIATLAGANPLREAADAARRGVEQILAALAAEQAAQRRVLADERATLTAEQQRLQTGEDAAPAAPPWRAGTVIRQGEPLWRLIDFAPEVPVAERAGIEAALEAAGLLDALVCADGTLLDAAASDVRLVVRSAQPSSLLGPLQITLPEGCSLTRTGVAAVLAGIAYGPHDGPAAPAWIAPDGRFRIGPATGRHHKAQALHIGHAARTEARRQRLAQIEELLAQIDCSLAELDQAEAARRAEALVLAREHQALPADDGLRKAEAEFGAAERHRREAQARLGDAESRLAQAERAWQCAGEELRSDAEDLQLPVDAEALDTLERALHDYRHAIGELVHAIEQRQRAATELAQQQHREQQAQSEHAAAAAAAHERDQRCAETLAVLATLRDTVGEAVDALRRRIADAEAAERRHDDAQRTAHKALIDAGARAAAAEQRRRDALATLEERSAQRAAAIEHLRAFASTGLLSVAVAGLELPSLDTPWGIEAALNVARRSEQALAEIESGDEAWGQIQRGIGNDLTQLQQAMSAQGHAAVAEPGEHGLVVRIVVRQRAERPDVLAQQIAAELAERRAILSAHERKVLEGHLQQDIAVNLQRLIQDTERRVVSINAELQKRPTSTGMRYRLDWQPLPEDNPDAPVGLTEARKRLLKTHADAWSADDRRTVGEFLHARIQAERSRDGERGATASMFDSLARALDYRRWHRFRVQRRQGGRDDGGWKPLAGPASSGERALGLTVPLFAAASSHYESAAPHAPRLVLLDEAFAGIDDEARANCMALIREFDLDFVMTSEREWGCYAELPGLSICQIVRREGVDAVFVSRWSWDGRARRHEEDPDRRFPPAASETGLAFERDMKLVEAQRR